MFDLVWRQRKRATAGLAAVTLLASLAGLAVPAGAAASVRATGPHRMVPRPPHGARPAASAGPVTDHGGPVQTAPKVYVDFWHWTSDPSGEQSYLEKFLSSVGSTS